MKKIRKYLGVRSVRLGSLAVLVATFVGLPALGRAINTDAFEKLDAVNYLSSVILAEDVISEVYTKEEYTTGETSTYNTSSSMTPCTSKESCESMSESYNSIDEEYTQETDDDSEYTEDSSSEDEDEDSNSSCTDSSCETMTEYGFQNCSSTSGCSFNYEYSGSEYSDPVGSQVSQEKSQLSAQLTQNANITTDWTRFSTSTTRLADKFSQAASQIATKGGNNSKVTEMLSAVASIDSDVTGNINEMTTYYNSLKSSVSGLSSTSTAGEVASVKTATQMLQTYNTLSQAMDVRVAAAKQAESLADMYLQIANVKAQYKGSVPSSVQKKLDAVQSQADKLAEYITDANEQYNEIASDISSIRSETDPDKASAALAGTYSLGTEVSSFSEKMSEDFEEFWSSNPMSTLNMASTAAQSQQLQGSMTMQISSMKEGIAYAKTGLAAIQSLNLGKSSVVTALKSLSSSADKMTTVMTKMEIALTASDGELSTENTEKFMEIQDSIMSSVETNMSVVTEYLNENKSLWENSPDAATIEEFINEDISGYDEAEDTYGQTFDDIYSESAEEAGGDYEALKEKIRAEVMAELTQQISASLMAEISKYIGEDKAGEILSNFLNKSTIFGEAGASALQATTDMLDVTSSMPTGDDVVVTEGTEDEVESLQDIIDEVSTTVISDEESLDMKESLETASELLSTGATSEELKAVTNQLQNLLEDNNESLTEEGLQFNDMTLAEDSEAWYFDSVMSLKQDGVVKGKDGDNYDATGEVTYAEVAKMAMEAAGQGKESGVPSDSTAVGQWYQGYAKATEEYAPEFNEQAEGQWNEPCPREWVAVLIGEAYELPQSAYEGEFKDVSSSDANSGYVQTLYDYGVMKGDSSGGTYRPDESINRAEVATVIYRADQSVGETQNIDETLESAEDEIDDLLEELGAETTDDSDTSEEPTAQKILSFLGNLRAMLPFLGQ